MNDDFYDAKKNRHEEIQKSLRTKEAPLSQKQHQDKRDALANKKEETKAFNAQSKVQKLDSKKAKKKKSNTSKVSPQDFFSAKAKQMHFKKQALNASKKKSLSSTQGSKDEAGEENEQLDWVNKGETTSQGVNEGRKKVKNILEHRDERLRRILGSSFDKNYQKEKFFSNKKEVVHQRKVKFTSKSKSLKKWSKSYFKELLKAAVSPKALAVKFSLVGGWLVAITIFLFLLLFFVGGLVNSSSQAARQNEAFNPNASVAERAQKVYNQIKKQVPRATPQGICAWIGNWDVESSINSKRAEGDYLPPPVGAKNDKDPCWDNEKWLAMGGREIYNGGFPNILHRGLGLGQWTDTSDGGRRHTMLLEYAKSQKKKWYDLSLQIDFALNGDSPYNRALFKAISESNQSVEALADQVATLWEGNSGDKMQQRKAQAQKWFNYFKNGGGSGAPSASVPKEYLGKLPFPNPSRECSTSGYPGNAYASGQCTWYVYNRFYQLGKVIPAYLGNGGQWGASAAAQGYSIKNTPKAGYAVSFPPGVAGAAAPYGHVAFVEYVNSDGSFLVSEMNMNGGLYKIDYRVISSPVGMNFIDFKLEVKR
ncbi:phage tail tip lysozyme [Lactococcus muris]|uniref:Phage tail tip lysozyme n=1 Tax=Lactococcus muris TaxID=2941330 RepID=A0ABV4D8S7_9LACT